VEVPREVEQDGQDEDWREVTGRVEQRARRRQVRAQVPEQYSDREHHAEGDDVPGVLEGEGAEDDGEEDACQWLPGMRLQGEGVPAAPGGGADPQREEDER